MALVYLYSCRICKKKFEGEEKQKICPYCENVFIERRSKRTRMKILRKKTFSGHNIKVGKACLKCIHSEKSTSLGGVRCTMSKPETTLDRTNQVWLCYSFEAQKKLVKK